MDRILIPQIPLMCSKRFFPDNSMNTNSQGADMEDSRLSLDNAVGSPTFQGVDELAEMDDWGSAWQEVKEKGENWGGRGKGGRGIQRNTWQPKDIFVEGEQSIDKILS